MRGLYDAFGGTLIEAKVVEESSEFIRPEAVAVDVEQEEKQRQRTLCKLGCGCCLVLIAVIVVAVLAATDVIGSGGGNAVQAELAGRVRWQSAPVERERPAADLPQVERAGVAQRVQYRSRGTQACR